MRLGGNVRRLRMESGMTQHCLAARVGRTRQWVSALEKGKIAVSLDAVDWLASELDVDHSDLLAPLIADEDFWQVLK